MYICISSIMHTYIRIYASIYIHIYLHLVNHIYISLHPYMYICISSIIYTYICIFIGKVVNICLGVSVNLVYKFKGKPGTTTVKHDFNPNGLKFHRGSPWVSILSWLNLKANKDYFSYESMHLYLYISACCQSCTSIPINMCMYLYICISSILYTYIYIYLYMHLHLCIYTYVSACRQS